MPGPIIKSYLLRDTVDSTAEAIYLLNASGWASPADVPIYLYTSLCTLWTGSSGNVAALDKAIVSQSGQGTQKSRNVISISPLICESVDAGNPEGKLISDDAQGAENALIRILFQTQQAPPESKFSLAQNAELRVRLLLDCNLRSLSGGGTSIPIDNTHDKSIDSSYETFILNWLGYETDPSAVEVLTNYACSYVRCFGKAIIPL